MTRRSSARSPRWLWVPTVVALALGAAFLSVYRSDLPIADLHQRYANGASRFVSIGDLRVHYRFEGDHAPDKPVVVLLHGTGASLHTWDGWAQLLQPDFAVLRLDLPGFGLTGPRADRDYSLDAYLRFLDDFTRELGVDRFHLVGNSLGGRIAWNYSLRHSERVIRLVLIDASGLAVTTDDPAPTVVRLARASSVSGVLVRCTPRSLIRNTLLDVYGNQRLLEEATVDRYYDLARRPGNRQAFVDRALAARSDQNGDIAAIQQPTLILWGALDHWIPVEHARRFAAGIRDSRLIIYPDAGHLPMEELPGPTARATASFLRQQPHRDSPD